MPDTIRGNFPDTPCSDCGEMGTVFQHWGSLVSKGETGNFCMFCWNERLEAEKRGEPPKPLGVKPPGVPKEFVNSAIVVKTESGSVYAFSVPSENGVRTVSCERKPLDFSICKIICLVPGRSLYLKILDAKDPNDVGWFTTPVVSIGERK